MIHTIYARKSTDQTAVADEAKSVTTQIENAKAFIASKGWTLAAIFKDDGVSGAEFVERRPGFVALIDALRPEPALQALVMSEESRLGRSTDVVPYVLGKLTKAGVEV